MNRGLPIRICMRKDFICVVRTNHLPAMPARHFGSNRIINKIMVSSRFSKEIISNDLLVRKSIFISCSGAVAKRDGTKEEEEPESRGDEI